MDIIPHEDLRDLVRRGPKYREQRTIIWGYCKTIILDSLERYIDRWLKKENAHCHTLDDWKRTIKEIINSKLTRAQVAQNLGLSHYLQQYL